jgi:hypothetical protein
MTAPLGLILGGGGAEVWRTVGSGHCHLRSAEERWEWRCHFGVWSSPLASLITSWTTDGDAGGEGGGVKQSCGRRRTVTVSPSTRAKGRR